MLPILPGAVGYGVEGNLAGRGGETIVVKSLAPSGEGSLQEACWRTNPRTIILDVAGTIDSTQNLRIRGDRVRICGQLAPGRGVTFAGAGIEAVDCSDLLIEHLKIRVGDRSAGPGYLSRDGIRLVRCKKAVISHCSVSWAIDELVDIFECDDVTIRNSILAECLVGMGDDGQPLHPNYPDGHSCGMLIKKSKRVFVHKNVFSNNRRRNAQWAAGSSGIQADNLIYNPASQAIGMASEEGGDPIDLDVEGNYLIAGKQTPSKLGLVHVDPTVNPASKLFMYGNLTEKPRVLYNFIRGASCHIMDHASNELAGHTLLTADAAGFQFDMLRDASPVGAKYWVRDSVDGMILEGIKSRKGLNVNSQEDVGGLPILKLPFVRPTEPETYTDLEILLNDARNT